MKKNNDLTTIVIAVIGIFLVLSLGANMIGFSGMGMMGYGFGTMWLFGWLFMILVIITLVLFIVWLIKEIQKK